MKVLLRYKATSITLPVCMGTSAPHSVQVRAPTSAMSTYYQRVSAPGSRQHRSLQHPVFVSPPEGDDSGFQLLSYVLPVRGFALLGSAHVATEDRAKIRGTLHHHACSCLRTLQETMLQNSLDTARYTYVVVMHGPCRTLCFACADLDSHLYLRELRGRTGTPASPHVWECGVP